MSIGHFTGPGRKRGLFFLRLLERREVGGGKRKRGGSSDSTSRGLGIIRAC